MSKSEIVDFSMHPKMLFDIIRRQAGTLDKAITEAAMNAVEAGATQFKIDFTPNKLEAGCARLVMTDNGHGIPTREELESHFKEFGTPHEESENKTWAQFRIGRGQCFAMGKNVWETCGWRMETDIDDDESEARFPRFILTKAKHFAGCKITIDIYKNKWHGSVEQLKSYVTEQLAFVKVDVIFNGEKVNRDPATLNWTDEDDDAYYLFGVGHELVIYNLGVRVEKIPPSRSGCVGVIISKHRLLVNFARNQVLSDCEVMQRINKIVVQNRVKKTRKSQKRLESYERTAALLDLRDGIQTYKKLKGVGLFYTTSGRSLTFNDIIRTSIHWTFAEHGNVVADKLMQSGQALCLDRKCLDELSYTGDEQGFFAWLTRADGGAPNWSKITFLYKPFDTLRAGFNETSSFIPCEKWSKLEKRLVRVLEGLDCWGGRRILIGLGDAFNAWTDGERYICLEREYIRQSSFTQVWGAAAFFSVLVHELAHSEVTNGTHCHGEEFYRAYHNLCMSGNSFDDTGERWHAGGPFRYLKEFIDKMKRAVEEERHEHAFRQEKKAAERVEKKLTGAPMAASTKKTRAVTPQRVSRRKSKRRIPGGAA